MRLVARVLRPLALLMLLGGCDVHPLYGTFGSSTLRADLEAIAVDPIPDRFGHYLNDELITRLNGTGSTPVPRFRLLVIYKQRLQTPLLDRTTGIASSATIIIDADFRLVPAAGGDPITKGTATAFGNYDRTQLRYSNLRAARDDEIRLAKTLADQIATRISATLASR